MDFLKNRKTAVAVFVAVVIVFSLIGCHRSLSKACRDVEAAFFEPASLRDDYYTCPAEQLEHCVRYANSILSTINSTLPESIYNGIYESRRTLIEALETRDISDIYDAQRALTLTVDAADREAHSMGVHEDLKGFSGLVTDYMNAANEAADSGYNTYVDEFMNGTANRFPTNLLRRLSFVDMPEKYE